jgi:regulator of sirC expression with transglutaminase-like and TPR domain
MSGGSKTPSENAATYDRAGQALSRLAVLGDYPPEVSSDLVAAALALSRLERPGLDLAPYFEHVRDLVDAVGQARALDKSPATALRKALVDTYGYCGDEIGYDDLDNADMARVIDRKCGLPVALGILWISVARAHGWQAEGLDVPNHFLIRVFEDATDRATGRVFDPFHGGKVMSDYEIEMMTHRMGGGGPLSSASSAYAGATGNLRRSAQGPRAVSDRSILLRLLNNIKLRRFQAEDLEGGLATLSTMRTVAPDIASLALEQASILARGGAFSKAHELLAGYLTAGHGDEGERRDITRFLGALRSSLN